MCLENLQGHPDQVEQHDAAERQQDGTVGTVKQVALPETQERHCQHAGGLVPPGSLTDKKRVQDVWPVPARVDRADHQHEPDQDQA